MNEGDWSVFGVVEGFGYWNALMIGFGVEVLNCEIRCRCWRLNPFFADAATGVPNCEFRCRHWRMKS